MTCPVVVFGWPASAFTASSASSSMASVVRIPSDGLCDREGVQPRTGGTDSGLRLGFGLRGRDTRRWRQRRAGVALADIFISYKRADRERVERLAAALEAHGYTVWWDLELVAGDRFERKIRGELEAAQCVVVVWTAASIDREGYYLSDWVRNEADEGHKRRVLVPVLLDEGRVAWIHKAVNYENLVGWTGDPDDEAVARLVRGIARHAGVRERPEDREVQAWSAAEQDGSPAAFRAFVAAHPDSRFANLARDRLADAEEAAAWAALGPQPTVPQLATFLSEWPSGRFSRVALERLRTVPPATVPPASVPPATVPPATVPRPASARPARQPPAREPPASVPSATEPPAMASPPSAPDPSPSPEPTPRLRSEPPKPRRTPQREPSPDEPPQWRTPALIVSVVGALGLIAFLASTSSESPDGANQATNTEPAEAKMASADTESSPVTQPEAAPAPSEPPAPPRRRSPPPSEPPPPRRRSPPPSEPPPPRRRSPPPAEPPPPRRRSPPPAKASESAAGSAREPRCGTRQTIAGLEYVYVCGGAFTMGSNDGDRDEKPPHKVRISSFWMQRYEFRRGEAKGRSQSGDPRLPLTRIGWADARGQCEAYGARLPTEAEWEYAARGKKSRKYPWGDAEPTKRRARFGLDYIAGPEPVDARPAGKGPFGTEQQAGNVWEWVCDAYDEDAYSKAPRGDDPNVAITDPSVGCDAADGVALRVVRGGSFFYSAEDLRSASRDRYGPGFGNDNLGFRCARSPLPSMP